MANEDVTGNSDEADLATVFAHELGHCVGLGDQEHPDYTASVMWWGYTPGTEYSGLSDADVAAAIFIYGA